ncbi:hypothetical protein EVAR_4675_1 [Eumeta japonica]|uniref:Uncharacterized protein n=1 Tax=Eumeta variegata TaxID=151549 RepID=A0A4C1Y934_EUMVA|nr:hypothetical protein EVAR_4675_1 [Eumeta japonica]
MVRKDLANLFKENQNDKRIRITMTASSLYRLRSYDSKILKESTVEQQTEPDSITGLAYRTALAIYEDWGLDSKLCSLEISMHTLVEMITEVQKLVVGYNLSPFKSLGSFLLDFCEQHNLVISSTWGRRSCKDEEIETMGNYQAAFMRYRSTDDHIFVVRRILDEKWKAANRIMSCLKEHTSILWFGQKPKVLPRKGPNKDVHSHLGFYHCVGRRLKNSRGVSQ